MFQLVAGVGLRHFAAFEASLEQEKDSADFLLVKRLDTWLFSEDFERQAEPYFLDRFKEWWSSRGSPGVLPAQVDLAFAKASLTEHLHEVIATIKAKAELIAKAESFVAQGDVPASINDIRSRMNQAEMDASAAKRKEDLSNRHREAIDTLDHWSKLQPLWIRWLLFLAGAVLKYLPKFVARKDKPTTRAEVWRKLEPWIAEYVDPNAVDALDAANRRIDV
jgi:hypothetical protein